MTGPRPLAPNLVMVQLGLILGPILLAGVAYALRQQPGYSAPAALPDGVQYALPVICVLALGGVMVVRGIRANAKGDQQFASLSIIGWATSEAAALAGCVYYFMNGDPKWAVTGIFVQLFSALLLPAKRPT